MNTVWAAKQGAAKGFTIIELLVSIAVIGILAMIMIVSYNGIQQRARDNERNSDLTQLKVAIEKYHAEESQYPDACGDGVNCSVTALASPLQPYLSTIPHDPRNASGSATDYRYIRGSSSGKDYDSYGILVTYESKPVCKTGVNVDANWWGTTIPNC